MQYTSATMLTPHGGVRRHSGATYERSSKSVATNRRVDGTGD